MTTMKTMDDKVKIEADKCFEKLEELKGIMMERYRMSEKFVKDIQERLKDSKATMEVYSQPGPIDNEYITSLPSVKHPPLIIKWSILPLLEDRDCIKVKLNDLEYELVIQRDCLNDIYVQLYRELDNGRCINLLNEFSRDEVSFDNLRLELVE